MKRRIEFLARRRTFITLLGGAAAAWPLAARGQQTGRLRRVGVLMSVAADGPEGQARLAAFLNGLRQAGWIEGRNVRIDQGWGAAMPSVLANTRRSWSYSVRMSFWPAANHSVVASQQAHPHRTARHCVAQTGRASRSRPPARLGGNRLVEGRNVAID
jgi:hypothetical protein